MKEDFSVRIRRLRKALGWTQGQLGEKVGVNNTSISYYESGSRVPDTDVLEKLADVLDVSVDYLMGRTDTPVMYTHAEQKFLADASVLTPEDLMEKYHLKIGDQEATPEEVLDMVNYIKAKRIMRLMNP